MKAKLFGFSLIMVFLFIGLMTKTLWNFVYFYPLVMSLIWVIGGLFFFYHWERKAGLPDAPAALDRAPKVSILIPCYNESENVIETIAAACAQIYPDFEVIAINDGSSDDTGVILDSLASENPRLRVVHHAKNQGKAMALRMGALVAEAEYLVCVDGDALLHPTAVAYLVKPMIDHPRVGAVTGNPRIRNRASLLGRMQMGEFFSIMGLIKRAQRIYGLVFTVSGVIAAFRKRALHDCGYWDLNMQTEDIDISWSLQLKHWQIQYEPCALVWVLMPETLGGLWKQRLRWAQGGAEVYFKNILNIWRWQDRRIWLLTLDFCLSATWAFAFAASLVLWGVTKYTSVPMPNDLNVSTILLPMFWGVVLATVSLVQCAVALMMERDYDERLTHALGWAVWYSVFFWMMSLGTTLVGLPKALLSNPKKRAVWESQDRGFR